MRLIPLLIFLLTKCSSILSETLCDLQQCTCDREISKISCSCASTQAQDITFGATYKYKLPESTKYLLAENCQNVTVNTKAFSNLPILQQVKFYNVSNLNIKPNAFLSHFKPSFIFNMVNTSEIPSYTFKGAITNITFFKSQIQNIAPFAFAASLDVNNLHFLQCNIKKLDTQAFKKFSVTNFVISKGRIGATLPSRTIYDLNVLDEFNINGLVIEGLYPSSLIIRNPKIFHLYDCMINQVEKEALRIFMKGEVHIRNNQFKILKGNVFSGIKISNTYNNSYKQQFDFENNTIDMFETGSLNFMFSDFDIMLDHISIKQPCTCDLTRLWSYKHNNIKNGSLWCLDGTQIYTNFQSYQDTECSSLLLNTQQLFILVTVPILVFTILFIAIVIVVCRRNSQRKKTEWINIATSSDSGSDKSIRKEGKILTMIVPDGRIYKETELHIVVEKAEPFNVSTSFDSDLQK